MNNLENFVSIIPLSHLHDAFVSFSPQPPAARLASMAAYAWVQTNVAVPKVSLENLAFKVFGLMHCLLIETLHI